MEEKEKIDILIHALKQAITALEKIEAARIKRMLPSYRTAVLPLLRNALTQATK